MRSGLKHQVQLFPCVSNPALVSLGPAIFLTCVRNAARLKTHTGQRGYPMVISPSLTSCSRTEVADSRSTSVLTSQQKKLTSALTRISRVKPYNRLNTTRVNRRRISRSGRFGRALINERTKGGGRTLHDEK